MSYARQASLDWVRRALAEELRDNSPTMTTRAENLVAIAEYYQIPIEALIRWIHTRAPRKQWTAAEWRRWCEEYRSAAAQQNLFDCSRYPD
jgi:inhibitor of KinA sporulation pathway (predicted exonuclease)